MTICTRVSTTGSDRAPRAVIAVIVTLAVSSTSTSSRMPSSSCRIHALPLPCRTDTIRKRPLQSTPQTRTALNVFDCRTPPFSCIAAQNRAAVLLKGRGPFSITLRFQTWCLDIQAPRALPAFRCLRARSNTSFSLQWGMLALSSCSPGSSASPSPSSSSTRLP